MAEALLYAQMEYPILAHNQKVDFVPKSGKGRVKYSYADLAHTKATIGPCLHRHGLVVNSTMSDDNTRLITRMRHIYSQEVDETSYLIGTNGDQKEQGGNITWARRYNWCLLTGCVGEEDNDAERITRNAPKQKNQKTQPPVEGQGQKKLTAIGIKAHTLAKELGYDLKDFLGVETTKPFTTKQYSEAVKDLEACLKAAVWFADRNNDDIELVKAWAKAREGGWKVLRPLVRSAVKDKAIADKLWEESTAWMKENVKPENTE